MKSQCLPKTGNCSSLTLWLLSALFGALPNKVYTLSQKSLRKAPSFVKWHFMILIWSCLSYYPISVGFSPFWTSFLAIFPRGANDNLWKWRQTWMELIELYSQHRILAMIQVRWRLVPLNGRRYWQQFRAWACRYTVSWSRKYRRKRASGRFGGHKMDSVNCKRLLKANSSPKKR